MPDRTSEKTMRQEAIDEVAEAVLAGNPINIGDLYLYVSKVGIAGGEAAGNIELAIAGLQQALEVVQANCQWCKGRGHVRQEWAEGCDWCGKGRDAACARHG